MAAKNHPKTPKRIGSVIKLKPGMYEKYKELHAAVWPEVLKRIYESNIRNYTIYYDKHNQLLFSHMEYIETPEASRFITIKAGDNFERDMEAINNDPVTHKWWKHCEPCQESLEWTGPPPSEGGKGGHWWAPCEEMFHDGHPPAEYQ